MQPGQLRCLKCPINSACYFNESSLEIEYYSHKSYTSEQPDTFDDNQEVVSLYTQYFNLVLGIASALVIVYLLSSNQNRKFLMKIDYYKLRHNYEVNKQMYIRKTVIGGLSTLLFVFFRFLYCLV